jgi:hypothetical protein
MNTLRKVAALKEDWRCRGSYAFALFMHRAFNKKANVVDYIYPFGKAAMLLYDMINPL